MIFFFLEVFLCQKCFLENCKYFFYLGFKADGFKSLKLFILFNPSNFKVDFVIMKKIIVDIILYFLCYSVSTRINVDGE